MRGISTWLVISLRVVSFPPPRFCRSSAAFAQTAPDNPLRPRRRASSPRQTRARRRPDRGSRRHRDPPLRIAEQGAAEHQRLHDREDGSAQRQESIADLVALHARRDASTQSTKNVSIRGVNSDAGDATTGIYIDDTPIQIAHARLRLGQHPAGRVRSASAWKSCADRRARCSARARKAARCATSRRSRASPITASTRKTEISDDRRTARRATKAAPRSADRSSTTSWASASAPGDGTTAAGSTRSITPIRRRSLQSDTNSVDTYVVRGARRLAADADAHASRRASTIRTATRTISTTTGSASPIPTTAIYKTGTPENMGDKDHFTLSALKGD